VDGDNYEEKNRERQRYTVTANKALTSKDLLAPLFPELTIEAKSAYVDENTALVLIREGDAVFLCVDNHATRKVVSDHIASLANALLVSGGNDLYDGNVQVYERKDGEDITPPLDFRHPEIDEPKDQNPADLACGELVQAGAPQILAVNLAIASMMLNAFSNWLRDGSVPYREQYFDLKTGNVRAVPHTRPAP
jgi:molybdopterin/thiamine biosynthesis adenylyltransferase